MSGSEFEFTAQLWEYHAGAGSWHFVTLPDDVSDDIAELAEGRVKAFGSVAVEVSIGGSRWRTSLFPSKQHRAYLLPVKKQVRTAAGVAEGDDVEVRLELRLP